MQEEHFCKVLNRTVPDTPAAIAESHIEIHISHAYITKKDFKDVIKATASGKSAGVDAISAEVLKVDLETAALRRYSGVSGTKNVYQTTGRKESL